MMYSVHYVYGKKGKNLLRSPRPVRRIRFAKKVISISKLVKKIKKILTYKIIYTRRVEYCYIV